MNRINIGYEKIVDIALDMINEITELVYEGDDKTRSHDMFQITAIIDFLKRLDYATRTEEKND